MLDKDNATKLFGEMLHEFGGTAQIHMELGLAYGNADFPEEQFRNSGRRLPEMTGFLTPWRLLSEKIGDTAFPEAEAEFRRELSIHPDDFFSYYGLLGARGIRNFKKDSRLFVRRCFSYLHVTHPWEAGTYFYGY